MFLIRFSSNCLKLWGQRLKWYFYEAQWRSRYLWIKSTNILYSFKAFTIRKQSICELWSGDILCKKTSQNF